MNLDVKLLGKAIQCHGLDLVDKIKEEQQTEPSSSLMSYLDRRRPVETEEKNEMFLDVVRSFIARKSDMLFKPVEAPEESPKTDEQDHQEVADVYAIMPPLETFMSVPSSVRRDHFYNSLSKEDCVTGVVTSVLDTGLLVRLLCVDVGPSRDLDGLDVMAFCPAKELPRLYAKESALDAFQQNDIVRGIVLSVNPETERIILSLHEKSIPQEKTYPRIGLITEEEFPVHYRRKSEAKNKDYEDILESVMGFNNVGNIKALVQQQGFSEVQSFTRSLSRLNIPKMEYAEGLHKWQAQKMAHQNVALGVGMFKDGKYIEAMQHFNKALQIDTENVEALVARGALYANKENFGKAVADFRQALSINATHSNARNYLIETLLTMGKLQEDGRHLEEACQHYQQVLEIDPGHTEAKDMLAGCQKLRAFQENSYGDGKSLDKTEGKGLTHQSTDSDSDLDSDVDRKLKKSKSTKAPPSSSILSKSTEKLLQLIKEDESKMGRSKKKRKHKRSTDQSSPEKEEPKKKRKAHTSSRASSSDSDSHERQKGKGSRMGSSPRDIDRGSSVRIKDKAASFQESNLLTARLQSPTRQPVAEAFLPFSSQRFFSKSTIPGLGSPPPSDANLEREREISRGKRFDEAGLSSPGVEAEGESRPLLSRRDSYLMEQRKKFYEKEKRKSPSQRRKEHRGRSSSSSSSRSSSSSSSSSQSGKETHKGKGRRRGRSDSSSPEQRGRGRGSSSKRSRSKSRSRSGSYKEPLVVKTRTGVAELDMYLGDRSSGKTIMALLGYGSKSPRRSPPTIPPKSRSRSRSPVKRVKGGRRSESGSPVRRRSDRSLSRSSGGSRRRRLDKESTAGRLGKRSRSRSHSHESVRPKPQHGKGMSREWTVEETEKSIRRKEKNRPRTTDPERDRETKEGIEREKQVQAKGDHLSREAAMMSDRKEAAHKSYSRGGGDKSRGSKEEEKPKSRPFLPRVLRKPAMDDPGLAQRTMSSKEYDAIMKEKRMKKDQSKTSPGKGEAGKSREGTDAVDKKLKGAGSERDHDSKTSKHRGQESRKSRHEKEEGLEDKDGWKVYEVKGREKHINEARERGTSNKTSKSDQRDRSEPDLKNDSRERRRLDGKSNSKERGKSGEKDDDISLKKTILMASDDLEKEIERRVQERLKEEEKKEKEKRAKERSGGGREEKYIEVRTGWTKDSYGKMYFAGKNKVLPVGYHKDKFGKTYFVGPHPETNELGESQRPFLNLNSNQTISKGPDPDVDYFARKLLQSSSAEAEKDKRKGRTSVSPRKKRDSRSRGKSTERRQDCHEYGRPSLSSRKGSVREDEDSAEIRRNKRDEKPSSKKSRKASDSDGGDSDFEAEAYDSRRLKRTVEEDLDRDLPSASSTRNDSPRGNSRWDVEDGHLDEKVEGSSRPKRKKISAESLTDLEKFLTSLKQRKKQQWIAEGKIKEKE